MSDYEKMLEKMRDLSDEQLKEIVLITFEDYTDFAIEAAKAVLEERGVTESVTEQKQNLNSPDFDFETFGDCIKLVDYQMIENKLMGLFKEPDRNLELFKQIYTDLRLMKPVSDDSTVLFIAQIKEDFRQGYLFDVFGMEEGQEGYFGLEMFSWSEWLGLKIFEKSKALILKIGLDEFVALCLKKMTTYGFTEGEIEEKIQEFESFGDELYPEDAYESEQDEEDGLDRIIK